MKHYLRFASRAALAAGVWFAAAAAAMASVGPDSVNPAVSDWLSGRYGIFPYDRPGVIVAGIWSAIIWGSSLLMLGLTSRSTSH